MDSGPESDDANSSIDPASDGQSIEDLADPHFLYDPNDADIDSDEDLEDVAGNLHLAEQPLQNPLASAATTAPATYRYSSNHGIPGYKWDQNSCWIDTSMQLLYIGLQANWVEFQDCCRDLPSGDPLYQFFSSFQRRRIVENDHQWDLMQSSLMTHRDDLRNALFSAGGILSPGRRKYDHHACLVCYSVTVSFALNIVDLVHTVVAH